MLIVISGAGGVGKGTLVAELAGRDANLWLSRSWTTRAQRPGESPTAYRFVSRDEFMQHVDAGGFLEWAEFLGNLYGTPWPDAPGAKDVVLEIDVQGAAQVVARDPQALLLFLVPPDAAELRRRLVGRGDPPDKVEARLAVAEEERREAQRLGATFVVNDQLDRAIEEVQALIRAHRAT